MRASNLSPLRWLFVLVVVAIAVAAAVAVSQVALNRQGHGQEGSGQQGGPTAGGPPASAPSADSPSPGGTGNRGSPTTGRPTSSPPETGAGAPPLPANCPQATITVTTASGLRAALAGASPGTAIKMADGIYVGNFVATGKGTADMPITLCGSDRAVLDGGGTEDGYVLHLDRAAHWIVQGFTIRNGQKGVMADETTHALLQGLTISGTGDEALHLRRFSSDNEVRGNVIRNTGLRKPKFGEGIYVGSAESNWCEISNCEPDRSDRNLITGNTISGTTAECIDIKEGTSDGLLLHNAFDGSALADADSWVDVKGRGWRIEGNRGRNSPQDGFQTHEIIDGWGTGNVFRNNIAEVNGPGLGYSLKPVRGNVVECSNTATRAAKGLSNEPCSTG